MAALLIALIGVLWPGQRMSGEYVVSYRPTY